MRVPIYEYECTQCGTVTDIRHGFKETASDPCAKCGAALKRVFRPAGIVFKGSGFYVTDSRKPRVDPTSSKPSADSGSAKPSSDGESSKSTGEAASSKPSESGKSETKSTKGSEAAA
ncbi:MAG: FmdB family zinc ribbon protein [Vulcanimicrobiaceae bacterium]